MLYILNRLLSILRVLRGRLLVLAVILSPLLFFFFLCQSFRRFFILLLFYQIINGFLAFTQSYIITQGKPMNSTLFYTVYMYQQSFEFYNTGYGAALAWVMLAMIGMITLFLFATKKFWVYEGGL